MTQSDKRGVAAPGGPPVPGEASPPAGSVLDANEIKRILPHRYPFLLVDRILEIDGERAVGVKNVSQNEPFFEGHFPDYPVMPGVLIIEAIAQLAGIVALKRLGSTRAVAFLTGIDSARFRDQVFPGDQLLIETRIVKEKAKFHIAAGTAKVGDKTVCEAELMFMLSEVTKI